MYFKVFNFVFYMGMAVFTYYNLYFKSIGITSSQIGTINSIAKAVALLSLPFWGMASDYYRANKKLLMVTVSGALVSSLLFLTTENLWLITGIMVMFLTFFLSTVPLADAQLLGYLGEGSKQYGKYRIWGSIGYTVVVALVGYFIEKTAAVNIFYLSAGIYGLTLFIIPKLPDEDVKMQIASLEKFKVLFQKENLLIFVVFTFFINLTFETNNIYFPLYVIDQGGKEFLIGISLMIAATSEMIVFYFSEEIMEHFKIKYIFLVSSLAFAFRWFLLAKFPILVVFLLSQTLHSLTFGLFHVTSVNYINELCGVQFKATGQNLYATSRGVSGIIGSFIGGFIYQNLGGGTLYSYLSLIALLAGVIYFIILKNNSSVSYVGS
ncbi:MAG: MFS transporter [Bacillota bacterium]